MRVPMRIAKPLLLISTPIGVAGGLYEAFRLAGGLAFIMLALVALIGAAMAMLVATIRRERREELEQASVASRTVGGSSNSNLRQS
jgi:predicted lipid-binding transport protein (Tim44 family)